LFTWQILPGPGNAITLPAQSLQQGEGSCVVNICVYGARELPSGKHRCSLTRRSAGQRNRAAQRARAVYGRVTRQRASTGKNGLGGSGGLCLPSALSLTFCSGKAPSHQPFVRKAVAGWVRLVLWVYVVGRVSQLCVRFGAS